MWGRESIDINSILLLFVLDILPQCLHLLLLNQHFHCCCCSREITQYTPNTHHRPHLSIISKGLCEYSHRPNEPNFLTDLLIFLEQGAFLHAPVHMLINGKILSTFMAQLSYILRCPQKRASCVLCSKVSHFFCPHWMTRFDCFHSGHREMTVFLKILFEFEINKQFKLDNVINL